MINSYTLNIYNFSWFNRVIFKLKTSDTFFKDSSQFIEERLARFFEASFVFKPVSYELNIGNVKGRNVESESNIKKSHRSGIKDFSPTA